MTPRENTWPMWWKELKNLAEENEWPVNYDDPDSYKDLFYDGYSSWDALVETIRE